jgi:Fe-S-cluster containining protein
MSNDDRDVAESARRSASAALEGTVAQLATMASQLQESIAVGDHGRDDLEAGLRFIHLMLAHTRDQLSSLTVAHEALVATLVDSGALDKEAFVENRKLPIVRERERRSAQPDVILTDVVDKYVLEDAVEIDCLDRLPLCKARCCKLDFELAEQDLDEGVIRWDYGRPYVIAKNEAGYCGHNVEGKCSVYGARPASCRHYDCRGDRRIWLDFENRIPAP